MIKRRKDIDKDIESKKGSWLRIFRKEKKGKEKLLGCQEEVIESNQHTYSGPLKSTYVHMQVATMSYSVHTAKDNNAKMWCLKGFHGANNLVVRVVSGVYNHVNQSYALV